MVFQHTGRDSRMFNSTKPNDPDSLYVTWTEDLSVGHELIDADHQCIFDIANRLHTEITEDPDAEYSIVGEVLVELIDHTGEHFKREEALMQEIGFAGYEGHKLEHALLMNKVNDLHRQFMDGRRNISIEVWAFLQKWLISHILNSDMELGRSIRAAK
jgi:hemerythrin